MEGESALARPVLTKDETNRKDLNIFMSGLILAITIPLSAGKRPREHRKLALMRDTRVA
jgi:hypothetical protein